MKRNTDSYGEFLITESCRLLRAAELLLTAKPQSQRTNAEWDLIWKIRNLLSDMRWSDSWRKIIDGIIDATRRTKREAADVNR
ncbi:MAG: hypothetical protein HJJLKODD_02527 [Phycisphaerae bacterium]|nr:hypothetical protein [Phycisphaerae bacterium]